MFLIIVDVTNGGWGGGCGVCFGNVNGFHIGFNIKLFNPQPCTTMADGMTSWTLMSSYSNHQPPFGTSKGMPSIYIMDSADVPWFGPVSPRQGTQQTLTE